MRSDDPVKMRTEILQQVASLQLESTFLHLRLAARGGELQVSVLNLCRSDSLLKASLSDRV